MILAENRLVREALCTSLTGRSDLLVVGTAGTIEELQVICSRHRPQVALVEVTTLLAAIEALRRVRTVSPDTGLVIITSAGLSTTQVAAVAVPGVATLVSSTDGLDTTLAAIRRQIRSTRRRVPPPPPLTSRETMIVYLAGAGLSTPEIAKQLELRPRTVENHKRHIYEKLGVNSQSHAVARAISLGLLHLPGRSIEIAEPGRATLVLVHGQRDECRDEVIRSLVAQRLPFVVSQDRLPLLRGHWARWHRGPLVVVLVDPEPEDWPLSTSVHAPTLVVRCDGAEDQSAITDALAHGADGLVFRDDVARDLGEMLTIVSHGHFAMSGVYAAALARWEPPTVPVLTKRERDILSSIARGHTIRQTARALGIAVKTVENTQARLFRKLGARNRAEALTIADGWGLIDHSVFGDRGGTAAFVPRQAVAPASESYRKYSCD